MKDIFKTNNINIKKSQLEVISVDNRDEFDCVMNYLNSVGKIWVNGWKATEYKGPISHWPICIVIEDDKIAVTASVYLYSNTISFSDFANKNGLTIIKSADNKSSRTPTWSSFDDNSHICSGLDFDATILIRKKSIPEKFLVNISIDGSFNGLNDTFELFYGEFSYIDLEQAKKYSMHIFNDILSSGYIEQSYNNIKKQDEEFWERMEDHNDI